MPLFGGTKRPALDGLSELETKQREELTPELVRRTAGGDKHSQDAAAIEILTEKSATDKAEFLWPLLLGWAQMSQRHYRAAIESFTEASVRNNQDVRPYCAAGTAYLWAGQAVQSLGSAVTEETAPPNLGPEALYHEAERCYATAIGLTHDKAELVQLHQAASSVEQALARSVKKA